MRRVLFLWLIFFFSCPNLLAQNNPANTRLSIDEKNSPVKKILQIISEQSGFEFSYSSSILKTDQLISFTINNKHLDQSMDQLCDQLSIAYLILDDQIILTLPEEKSKPSVELSETMIVSGYIYDKETGESLVGANVSIAGTATGTTTNAFGYYVIELPADTLALQYSYVGFKTEQQIYTPEKSKKNNIYLSPEQVDLPDVVVALKPKVLLRSKAPSKMTLLPEEINSMPEFAGESGLVKSMQSLPGIKMNSDGSAFFFVRGGNRDQNLIIIDDAPIYNPSHLFGFYSMVVPDFAKKVDIYKSDVPVSLGDRLSSVISIKTKDGNLNKWQFTGALNPIVNRLTLEVPIVKKKGALFVSYRRSFFEWIYRRDNPTADLAFADLNFKVNYKFNDRNRVFFTLISGQDRFVDNGSGISWGNVATTIRWNHIFGPKLFLNTILYTGNYGYQLGFEGNEWQSGISSGSLKLDFTHLSAPGWRSNFGGEIQNYSFNPGRIASGEIVGLFPEISENFSQKAVLYYEGQVDFNENLQLKAGLRFTNWKGVGQTTYYTFGNEFEVTDTVRTQNGTYQEYTNLAPRLSLQCLLNDYSGIKLSLGRYYQYLQLISNTNSPFTALEIWLPASPNIRPQEADQISLDYFTEFAKKKYSFSSSIYYKNFRNQIDYRPHAQLILNPLIEGELRFGKGNAYGLELMLKKNTGRLSGWVNYTYSRSLMRVNEINLGRQFPTFQDRPHDFSLMLNYQLKPRVLFSAYWTAYSGSAISSPTGYYTFNQKVVPVFDEKNNDRLPDYRRLDIAFKFTFNKSPDDPFQHSLTFSVYNFLAHKNVVSLNFNRFETEDTSRPSVRANVLTQQNLINTQTDLIRFFPSLTYKFKI